MTDLNKQELRRLAERVISIEKAEDLPLSEAWDEFEAAASPAAILALLDELAQAKCEAGHAIRQKTAAYEKCKAVQAEVEGLRKDARRWKCVRNPIPMQSPYAVWREGTQVVLGKDADDLVDNFLANAREANHA